MTSKFHSSLQRIRRSSAYAKPMRENVLFACRRNGVACLLTEFVYVIFANTVLRSEGERLDDIALVVCEEMGRDVLFGYEVRD